MPMLLTLSQSAHADLTGRSTHDFAPKFPHFRPRLSPFAEAERPIKTLQAGSRAHSAVPESVMATQHRGLPPPSSILAEPSRLPTTLSSTSSVQAPGPMPAPPMQWQGHEDSMRNWLAAKAEEDKRKQEEEKTRQETLKLEQRRIEQSMLRESLTGGVPPHMVPMIYAGIGGAGFAQLSMDWLHQYASQLQMVQRQVQPSSPEPRAQRVIGPYQASAAGQQSSNPYPADTAVQQTATGPPYSAYPTASRVPPTSAPRSIAQAQLPRLTTNDAFMQQQQQQPPNNPGSAHPLQQSQTLAQDAPASSPSIYFHHWVPPADSKNPSTPATKRRDDEPTSAHPGSHLSDGEYKDSPRKRKAQGGHQPNPPPSTSAPYGSPSFSTTSSVSSKRVSGHQRNRSTASFKDEPRPDSRKEERHRLSFVPPPIREDLEREDRRPGLQEENENAVPGAERKSDDSRPFTQSDRPPS